MKLFLSGGGSDVESIEVDRRFIDAIDVSGAFAFVWFLKQAGILDVRKLTPSALTALTWLVAESETGHKEKIIKLILNLLVTEST